MPRIPDQIPLAVPASGRQVVSPGRPAVSVRVVGQLGADLFRKRQEREDRLNYGRAAINFQKSMSKMLDGLDDDDYETYESRFEEAKSKALEESGAMILSERDREMFAVDMESRSLGMLDRLRSKAKAKEKDFGVAATDQALIDNRELVYSTPIESHQNAVDILEGARAAGYISAEEHVARVNGEKVGLVQAELEALSPMNRYERLKANSGTVALLPEETRNDMTLAAIRQQQALMTAEWTRLQRIHAMQVRQEKEAAEEASKQGDQLFASGKLTEDWVEENRSVLDEKDYRYFYKKLSGSENVTDAMTYADLRSRASGGEDVREESREALRSGRLKIADYDKIVSRLEQDVPNWMARGENHIKTSLRVSDINPDPAAAQRQAQALDDWNDWAVENPEATVDQAQVEYRRIVKEYALIDAEEMELVLRMPSLAVGGRQSLDLEATIQTTIDAYQSGELSQEQFEEQSELLLRWEEAKKRRLEASRE